MSNITRALFLASSSLLLVAALPACASAGAGDVGSSPAPPTGSSDGAESAPGVSTGTAESELHAGGYQCVHETIFVKPGFIADLEASVGAAYVKSYGPRAPRHVEVPRFLDVVLDTRYGDALQTLHAWDIHPEDLPAGSAQAPRLVASIDGTRPFDAKLTLRMDAHLGAKAFFDALTKAVETREDHIVPPEQVYDRSWIKVTRTSPAGRITCARTTYPQGTYPDPPHVEYTCTVTDVERTIVQIYNGKDAGKCFTR